ncbi:MAG: hypothetical protein ABIW76_14365 [Fibrobacteria bacterium]
MKLGETGDPIYATSFSIQEGYSTPEWPYDKAVKNLEMIDGSIEVVNIGAREHRTARFNFNWIPRTDHATLKAYLETNLGAKIRVTIENAGERVFGEQYTAGVYYAWVMPGCKSMGETQFIASHRGYGFSMELDLAGTLSTSVPNIADASQYDFLIKMDCARITPGCQVANMAALTAVTTKPGGSRGLTIDNLKVYFFNAGNSTWEYQYTLPANDVDRGLKYGVFRWSAFADISGASSGIGGEAFKSGWIVEKGIKPPRYSVNARKGPAMEFPEGFSFSAPNFGKLWKFPLENNLAFYGAQCELYFYDRLAGVLQLVRSGFANKNDFDYQKLEFKVEPGVLLQAPSYPKTTVGKDNFPTAADAVKGKPVIATFGRFDKGRLQTIAFNNDAVRFTNGRRYLNLLAWDNTNLRVTLNIDASFVAGILGYAIGSYPSGSTRLLYAAIFSQEEQPDLKKLRKVTVISSPAAGQVRLTLDKGFAAAPNSTSMWIIYLANNEMVIDDDPCVGLRTAGYLIPAAANGERIGMELYAEDGKGTVRLVPPHIYKMIEDGEENRLTVDSKYLSLEETGEFSTQNTTLLEQLPPTSLHDAIDIVVGTSYTHYPFGFSPDGVESNTILMGPAPRSSGWSRNPSQPGSFDPSNGAIRVGFSATFSTLIWSLYPGAVSHRVSRHIITGWLKKDSRSRGGVGATEGPILVFDSTFGAASSVTRTDGSVASASSGYISVTVDSRPNALIDSGVIAGREYVYMLEPEVDGRYEASILSNPGKNGAVPSGAPVITGVTLDQAFLIVWPVPNDQGSFRVLVDDVDVSGSPFGSATRGWYQHPATLSNGQRYNVKISVNCLSIGAAGDVWQSPYGVASDHAVHYLMEAGGDPNARKLRVLRDSAASNVEDDKGYGHSWALNVKRTTNDGLDAPAAALVFSEVFKVDHEALGDLSGATDVRLLRDVVYRSFVSNNYQIPILIQVRGIKRDKTSAFVIQGKGALQGKAATEGGSFGAYMNFLNLPLGLGGDDANYETESSASNADGLYTGKDLWKLDDNLFEDDAFLWKEVEYIVFSITNAAPIAYEWLSSSARGWRLGVGGPPNQNWGMVRKHKPGLFIEYTQVFEGGLEKPAFARIDGGIKDDALGTFTGTPSKIIEKARHVTDKVFSELTGKKPLYLGTEMKSRDYWIWRWQADESKSLQDTVDMFLKNLWAIGTISPSDGICIRTLNPDEKDSAPVFAFTPANILKDSLSKDGRRRNEIFQKFLLRYNFEPSVGDGQTTEEMLIGWDLATGKPIFSGYSRVEEDESGILKNIDGMDGMDFYVRVSNQLYAAGVAANEYGTDPKDPKIFEMFYRPTTPSSQTKEPVERTLPNLATLWPEAKAPKLAMQDLTKMVVAFNTLDAWEFTLSTPMKNVIYNPDILGVSDEAGTPDRRLKLGDLVTIQDDFYTNGQAVKGFILEMELDSLYDGYATLHVFCPRPPGQFGPGVDRVWDAGGPGPRNEANYLFKGNLYGLLGEAGTFADAKGPGARTPASMTFPDGSFADPKGTGSGKA